MMDGMIEFFERIDVFRDIEFAESKHHSYTIGGKRTVSVTKVTGSVRPPFDNMKVSIRSARKHLIEEYYAAHPELDPASNPDIDQLNVQPYEPPVEQVHARAQQLRTEWELTNKISTHMGSAAHKFIEAAMANKFEPYPAREILDVFDGEDPVKERYDIVTGHMARFKRDIAGRMIPVRSELVIGSPKYMVCGMIDQIFWNKKTEQLELWDWKTNAKFETESKYKLLDPVSHLSQSHLDEYSLQLSMYKRIFTEMTGLPLGNCYLCWFGSSQPTYRIFKCKDLSAEVDVLLQKSMEERKLK